MAREERNCALALVAPHEALESPPRSFDRTTTLLPPPPPVASGDFDLFGSFAGVVSLAALEAALDAIPFPDGEPLDPRTGEPAPKAEANDETLPPNERPTKRYTIPDVPPCMRVTARPTF
jgi:hypothetical protein